MNIQPDNFVVSLAMVSAVVIWGLLYWRTTTPRLRQWMRYSLLLGLFWALWVIWLTDIEYTIRLIWLGELFSRLELWLLIGWAISLLSLVWLRLPFDKHLNQVVRLDYKSVFGATLLIVGSGAAALLAQVEVMVVLVATVGALGLWRASYKPAYLISSLLCLVIAAAMTVVVGFGLPLIWSDMAGFRIISWWSIFDLPSYALIAASAFAIGPLCWWWLNQPADAN